MWTRRNERRTRSATFSCIAALTAAALLATAAPVAPRAAAAVAPSAAVADSVRLAPRAESPPPPSVDSAGKSLASADGQHPEWLDRSVAPSTDFFRFANGGWLKSHPIPPDRSYWGVDTILEQENQSFIRGLVESLGKDDWPEGSVERKVADFYASGMDERGIDAAGIAPLQPEFARIALISNPAELLEEIAHLQSIGVEAPLQIGQMQDFKDSTQVIAVASQSGLGLPNRDYYLKSAPTFAAARAAYVLHVTRMFALLGDAPADCRARIQSGHGVRDAIG